MNRLFAWARSARLTALGLALFSVASAQVETDADLPPVYRVEVIVVLHTGGQSDARRTAAPIDYLAALDPRWVAHAWMLAESHRQWLKQALPMLPPGREPVDPARLPALANDQETLRPAPPRFAARPRLSGSMARALERLQGAAAFEPIAWRSWFQTAPRRRAMPTVRIHDDQVIDYRPASPTGAGFPLFLDRVRVPVKFEDQAPVGFTILAEPSFAQPQYRLDGQIGLRRRQFLHAELDLTWQVPAEPGIDDRQIPEPDQAEWLTHRLVQSRIIRPDRLEYFDSARFGVLLLVTGFQQIEPEPELAPAPAPKPPAGETS